MINHSIKIAQIERIIRKKNAKNQSINFKNFQQYILILFIFLDYVNVFREFLPIFKNIPSIKNMKKRKLHA